MTFTVCIKNNKKRLLGLRILSANMITIMFLFLIWLKEPLQESSAIFFWYGMIGLWVLMFAASFYLLKRQRLIVEGEQITIYPIFGKVKTISLSDITARKVKSCYSAPSMGNVATAIGGGALGYAVSRAVIGTNSPSTKVPGTVTYYNGGNKLFKVSMQTMENAKRFDDMVRNHLEPENRVDEVSNYMKNCNHCGAQLDGHANYCATCGSSDLADITENLSQKSNAMPQAETNPQDASTMASAAYSAGTVQQTEPVSHGNGNVIAGIVGAFLFSLGGVLLYFLIYQMGFIAGICGLITFVLAYLGYGIFSGTKNRATVAGLITAIVISVGMIFVAEYLCVAYELFDAYKEYNFQLSFFDATRLVPAFLEEAEARRAVIGDLALAYLFSFFATIGTVIQMVRSRKRK